MIHRCVCIQVTGFPSTFINNLSVKRSEGFHRESEGSVTDSFDGWFPVAVSGNPTVFSR